MAGEDAPTILVTRPEPGASATAEKLREAGFNTIVVPFTQMVAMPAAENPDRFHDATIIIVTSANALRYLSRDIAVKLTELPVLTVGDATKQEALRQGFKDVRSADGNAQDLADLIRREVSQKDHVVYLCGAVRTTDIEDELNRLEFDFSVVETYKTVKISQLTYKINTLFSENKIDAVCFYSSVSAKLYAEVAETGKNEPKLLKIIPFCISERAKTCLPSALLDGAFVCEKPRDDAMIDLLIKHYQPLN